MNLDLILIHIIIVVNRGVFKSQIKT